MPSKPIKREVNLSLERQVRWKLNEFSAGDTELSSKYLCFGDIVWMNNTENDATIISDKKEHDIFEINASRSDTTNIFHHYIGNTNGMWILENVDFTKGGPIEWEKDFKLKHFSTGMYLVGRKISNQRFELHLESRTKNIQEETKFQFKRLVLSKEGQDNKRNVPKDAFTFLYHKYT